MDSAPTSSPRMPSHPSPRPPGGVRNFSFPGGAANPALGALAALGLPFAASSPAEDGAAPALPQAERIEVRCGEVGLLLRERSQWTPGRIDYRGLALSTERSAYGSVFRLPGVGFIGTAHHEVEPEELLEVSFHLDGVRVEDPGESIEAAESFHFRRVSRIRAFEIVCSVAIAGDRLYETTEVRCDEETPLELVYHFMHAWTPAVRAYLAGKDGEGVVAEGAFADNEEAARKFHVQAAVDWVAVHAPESGRFAVSRLLSHPEEAGQDSQIWNVPEVYRKYYLTSFRDATVPAGFRGAWEMVTAFGEADSASWREAATELANSLAGAAMPPAGGEGAADAEP